MPDNDETATGKTPPRDVSPEMRRGVSRRSLITDELRTASMDAVKKLPQFSPLLRFVLKETEAVRDERLVKNLWQLLVNREPKPEEVKASMEVVRNARTPEEKGDALVDVLWALCQTKDFAELDRPDRVLIRGLYRIAFDRDPTEAERDAALQLLSEADGPDARGAVLEGLLTGLARSSDCVLRKSLGR